MTGTDAGTPRQSVLVLAGTDPLGGAGLPQYMLALLDHGLDPLCIPTAIVVQNSHGVRSFMPVASPLLQAQLAAVLADCTPSAVVCSMLGSVENQEVVSRHLVTVDSQVPVVVDPVMRGGTAAGAPLAAPEMPRALLALLMARPGTWVTPNVDELARLLSADRATDVDTLATQARALAQHTGAVVLAKGGHLEPAGTDVLVTGSGVASCHIFEPHPAFGQAVRNGLSVDVHGTGCRLAAELTAALVQGHAARQAVSVARQRLAIAVRDAQHRVGTGRPQLGLVPSGAA